MARIALIDPSGRAATTVEAVLGKQHEIVVRTRIHAPGDVELVIADLRQAELRDQGTLRSLTSFGPVLLLVEKTEPIPSAIEESPGLSVLRKPFDAFELRLLVERLLRDIEAPEAPRVAERREKDDAAWLEFPFVPAPAGAVLRRAARMSAPLWILGEVGSGRRHIAIAVCRTSMPPLRVVTLFSDDSLAETLAREEGAEPYALLVPDIEQRSLLDQERLAQLLAGPARFRLVATSVDDPAGLVVEGKFSRSLYQHLVGLAVQVSPLRERPVTIPPLVQALVRKIARSLAIDGDISFSPDAMARLQTYMWPGNVVELESVLNRTLAYAAENDLSSRVIDADELLFTPEDTGRVRSGVRSSGTQAVVTRLQNETSESVRVAKAGASAAAMSRTSKPRREKEASSENAGRLFEHVFAGLAHDFRNPLVAIKTFAGASASGEASGELATLAGEACDRIDSYVEDLQRFGQFTVPTRQRVDMTRLVRLAAEAASGGQSERFVFEADKPVHTAVDAEQMRFVMENVFEACLQEVAVGANVVVRVDDSAAVSVVVSAGGGTSASLRRVLGSKQELPSWRVLLAKQVAERNGFGVEVEAVGEQLAMHVSPLRGEEDSRGEQTGRINR